LRSLRRKRVTSKRKLSLLHTKAFSFQKLLKVFPRSIFISFRSFLFHSLHHFLSPLFCLFRTRRIGQKDRFAIDSTHWPFLSGFPARWEHIPTRTRLRHPLLHLFEVLLHLIQRRKCISLITRCRAGFASFQLT